jgi:hypothetical protein
MRKEAYLPGRELPLPSDMDSNGRLVTSLEVLWMTLRRERITSRDIQARVVTRFFEALPEQEQFWLEGLDPRWDRPRSILVKERALQLYDRREWGLIDGETNKETVELIRTWLNEETAKLKGDVV